MILTCPECATRYQTDATLFAPPGRKVKCAKCGHIWQQAAPPPEQEFTIAPEEPEPAYQAEDPPPQRSSYVPPAYVPATETQARTQASGPSRSYRIGVAVGWLGLVGIILVIGWAAASYREQIAGLWPQSSTLYRVLGLKVNARGIEIDGVTNNIEKEDGQPVLRVSGTLVNITQRELSVPQLNAILTDDDKRTLFQWSFSPGVDTLAPGQKVFFRTRLSGPPAGVKHLEVRFGGTGG